MDDKKCSGCGCSGGMCKCKWGALIISILVLAVVVGGGFYCWKKYHPNVEYKIYTDEKIGYSFQYPSDLILENGGLWTQEVLNSPCYKTPDKLDGCGPVVPQIDFKADPIGESTLLEYILKDNSVNPKDYKTLEEFSDVSKSPYEDVNLDTNVYTKITVNDMLSITTYYLHWDKAFVSFKVYSDTDDNDVLKDILESLKVSM